MMQTKLFVSDGEKKQSAVKSKEVVVSKDLFDTVKNSAIDIGFEMLSQTLQEVTQTNIKETLLYRNYDTNDKKGDFPNIFYIVRGDFELDEKGEFGDGKNSLKSTPKLNRFSIKGSPKLLIMIETKYSKSGEFIYFQPIYLKYDGTNIFGKSVEKIDIEIGFALPEQPLEQLMLSSKISFNNISSNTELKFSNKKDFDEVSQSLWIRKPDFSTPYTFVVKVKEYEKIGKIKRFFIKLFNKSSVNVKNDLKTLQHP
jgi:hypothetical protein